VKEHTVTYHIKEIYKCNELDQNSTARKIRVVRKEGSRNVNRVLDFYNLDMILSVGYRVNSVRGIMFRRWSSEVLKQFMLRGYSVNQHLVAEQKYVKEAFDTNWVVPMGPNVNAFEQKKASLNINPHLEQDLNELTAVKEDLNSVSSVITSLRIRRDVI